MTDSEVLDVIEKLVDQHMQFMYDQNVDDVSKQMHANYIMGMIAGTMMRRNPK